MTTASAARLFGLVPSCALAVYAHPDDADVSCGGALARWSAQGAAVHLVVVTDGGKGSTDPDADTAALVATRVDEVARAAQALGLASVEHLGIPDGEVPEQQWLLGALVERIRRLRPEVVLAHDPTAVFFGGVYVNHRDHRSVGWAVLDAVAPASAMPLYFPGAGGPHRVPHVLLSGTLAPDVYVDVSSSIEEKIAAVREHRSQLDEDPDWVSKTVCRRAEDDGRVVGVHYAEGFRHLELDG
jgi:LmbE family N-acetylglucosaminyl deacetylase